MTSLVDSLGRIVPVIVIDDADRAVDTARALRDGGILCAEVTLRTPAALDAISAIARHVPDFIVGAGTVLHPRDAEQAIDAGAAFLVSPGLSDALAATVREPSAALIPGVATATEVMKARALGFTHLKLFPAEPLGGVHAVTALNGPFPDARFVPSGGIGMRDAPRYLQLDSVFAVSGSWPAPRDAIAAADYAEISRRAAATTAGLDNLS